MAKSILSQLWGNALKQAVRTATRDIVHQKTSGRWECPSCGKIKAPQALKHPTKDGTICTICYNKMVKNGNA